MLLGFTKTGFGTGLIVGIGGGIQDLETPAQAAERDLLEEPGSTVLPANLRDAARVLLRHPTRVGHERAVVRRACLIAASLISR